MSADLSRVRFDPFRDYAGVVLQQGRLLLDADFNEYVALLDRRLRAETTDLTSYEPDPDEAGSAWVPRRTPDGFRVSATGGSLTIGRGRMYVDGLLAENHGRPPYAFDPLLAERIGTTDPTYQQQPYAPTPEMMAGQATPPSGGPHLAYLDVWQREVTHVEAPDLVEVAVGVDTTARLQTAWQVRILPNTGGATCESDDDEIPGWLDVIRPSAGRLTTGTVDVDDDDDPCELPPVGGYRGIENQTYRVEIHQAGPPGTATFKWSRENASVAIPVVEMVSSTVLRLSSLGKDEVLGIATGNWVEILDDRYELGQKPGAVRKVTVDTAARTITFNPALPADLQPASATEAAARHLRVRRWDQSGVVRNGTGGTITNLDQAGSSGLITVPASASTQVVLEHGIAVSFSVATAGGGFRAGDHWTFSARTATASLELLDAAPPLGVHHHYARLGFVTFPDGETDCRTMWPPIATGGDCGDCTVCVTAETHSSGSLTIQDAVDQVRETGGTVCIGPGTFDVSDGVTVEDARSVRIRGQGPATILAADGTAVTVKSSLWTTIENLAVVSGAASSGAIRLEDVVVARLQDLAVVSYGSDQGRGAAVELSGIAIGVTVRDDVLVAPTGIGRDASRDDSGLLAAMLRIEGNVVAGQIGIDLTGLTSFLYSCRIADNDVIAGSWGGIGATGAVAPGGALDVSGNRIGTNGAGIAVGADATVDSNVVTGRPDEEPPPSIVALPPLPAIVVVDGGFPAPPGDVRITGNRVHDHPGVGIALRTPVRSLIVKQNVVSGAAAGIGVEGRGLAEHASIENNVLRDLGIRQPSGAPVAGLYLSRVYTGDVTGNEVARVATEQEDAEVHAGILVMGCVDVRVSGNDVFEIGPREDFKGIAAGILAIAPFRSLNVTENCVRFAADGPPPQDARWHAVLIRTPERETIRTGTSRATVPAGDGAVVVSEQWAYQTPRRDESATVATNVLAGGGSAPTCLVRVRGDVVLDANQCSHVEAEDQLAVYVAADTVTASSNRVAGVEATVRLDVPENRFAAVGNITNGGVFIFGSALPSPWAELNPVVS